MAHDWGKTTAVRDLCEDEFDKEEKYILTFF